MVRPERFELPTCCSGGNRSIQLSYGRTRVVTVYSAQQRVSTSNTRYHAESRRLMGALSTVYALERGG